MVHLDLIVERMLGQSGLKHFHLTKSGICQDFEKNPVY